MAAIERKTKCYPTDVTDEEWSRIAPLLPKPAKRRRRPSVDLREVVNAIRYMTRTGRRLADAAQGLPAMADGVLVVPAVRAADAVPDEPRYRTDNGSRAGPDGRRAQVALSPTARL